MNAVVSPVQDAQKPGATAQKPAKARPAALKVAKTAEAPASQQVRKPPRGINGFEIPNGAYREDRKLDLRNIEVIKLAETGFAHAHESFYNIEMVLPNYQNENADRIRETEAAMSALVGGLATDLANEVKRLRVLAKNSGVELTKGGYVPTHFELQVASRYASRLLNVFTDLDELYLITSAMTFNGAMGAAERVTLNSQWRNRIRRFIRSLKHHYVMLKNRGELPAQHNDAEADTGTDQQFQDSLERIDDAADGGSTAAAQAAA